MSEPSGMSLAEAANISGGLLRYLAQSSYLFVQSRVYTDTYVNLATPRGKFILAGSYPGE